MMLNDIVKEIAETVRESVEQVDKKYAARIAELEKQIAELKALPIPKDGKDGTSISVEDVKPLIDEAVSKAVSEIPPAKDGTSVSVEDVEPLITEAVSKAVSEIPAPKDGTSVSVEDVEPLITEAVSKAVSEIPVPKDGTSVSVEDVEPLIAEAVSKAVEAIPVPKDGKDAEVDYDHINEIVDKTLQEAVSKIDIPVAKDGQDGRDALDLEILPEIDEEKSYARGSYASHKGGLWRSYQRTSGMKGWECIVEGTAETVVEFDGKRKAVIKTISSSGSVTEETLRVPAIIHEGVWTDRAYEKGDCVQLSGSSWIAVKDTEERPGAGNDWICSAKRGGTGESAYDCARKAGFKGSKADWLDSLGKKKTVKVE